MSDVQALQSKLRKFRNERNWGKYHTPQNLAKSIAIESGELLRCFQWTVTSCDNAACDIKMDGTAYDPVTNANRPEITDEMADIFIYLLNMADVMDVDLIGVTLEKIKKNAFKYPVPEER